MFASKLTRDVYEIPDGAPMYKGQSMVRRLVVSYEIVLRWWRWEERSGRRCGGGDACIGCMAYGRRWCAGNGGRGAACCRWGTYGGDGLTGVSLSMTTITVAREVMSVLLGIMLE